MRRRLAERGGTAARFASYSRPSSNAVLVLEVGAELVRLGDDGETLELLASLQRATAKAGPDGAPLELGNNAGGVLDGAEHFGRVV